MCVLCAQSPFRRRAEQAVLDLVCNYRLTSNTVQSYNTQVAALDSIGQRYGILLDRPVGEQHLCLAEILYAQTHKPTTIRLFVSAIADWTRQRWNVELPRFHLYDTVLTSLFNLYGNCNSSTPKTAVTADDLQAIGTHLDTAYFEHARDWCACLIAFYGLLRIGEYMDGGLRMQHVIPSSAWTLSSSSARRPRNRCRFLSRLETTSSARYEASFTTSHSSSGSASLLAPTTRFSCTASPAALPVR